MHVEVRPATSADYDRVIGKIDTWWGGRAMSAMLPRLFFQHFQPWTSVAERDGEIAGFVAAFRSQTDPRQIYCHFIGVDPRCRGQGIGEALYHRLFADALAAGCEEVLAVTSPRNHASIAFHRRLGFDLLPDCTAPSDTAASVDYDGPGEDRVRFRKRLLVPGARQGRSSD